MSLCPQNMAQHRAEQDVPWVGGGQLLVPLCAEPWLWGRGDPSSEHPALGRRKDWVATGKVSGTVTLIFCLSKATWSIPSHILCLGV